MPLQSGDRMFANRESRIRVTNPNATALIAYVEPWGFDFVIPPGGSLEFEAEQASPDFRFEISHNGADRYQVGARSLSVHCLGSCRAIVVASGDGKRDRFRWVCPPDGSASSDAAGESTGQG